MHRGRINLFWRVGFSKRINARDLSNYWIFATNRFHRNSVQVSKGIQDSGSSG